ncbi:MAG: DNA polymerase IV [Phycisphaerales bacterium]|nr:DNA polymerase IV [Phycisphaerales bacterium]MCB9835830.1 DNA polymerase IV [Phycisphaera sp.]
MARAILHADLDAFFASVEQLDNPELRGKPVLVGGTGKRAVVAAASYEARAFGCRSAMPTATALRLCPHAVVVKPHGKRYRELSDTVFEIFESVTPLVEPLSIDEAFLDVTGSVRLLGSPEVIARDIRKRVHETTGLTVSVGVAPNKFLAKLASEMDKPDGLTIITPDKIQETLDPLPVSAIFGVGKAAEKKLASLGIRTIADLRHAPEELLVARLGSMGPHIHRLAQGIDDREVHPDHTAKSVGHEQTFGDDLTDRELIRSILLAQVEQVGRRLRHKGRAAGNVTLKIRFGDFETITRSTSLGTQTDSTEELWQASLALLETWMKQSFHPVRLIGMTASQLSGAEDIQPGLFGGDEREKRSRLDQAADEIARRFGGDSIRRAASFSKSPSQRANKPKPGGDSRA